MAGPRTRRPGSLATSGIRARGCRSGVALLRARRDRWAPALVLESPRAAPVSRASLIQRSPHGERPRRTTSWSRYSVFAFVVRGFAFRRPPLWPRVPPWLALELPRFRGHLTIGGGGPHEGSPDATHTTAL